MNALTSPPPLVGHVPFVEAKRRWVKLYLEELLAATDGNITTAARFAELERSHFKRLMDEHGVKRPRSLKELRFFEEKP